MGNGSGDPPGMVGIMVRFARALTTVARPGPTQALLAVSVLVVACHGGALFNGQQFGFRDSAHFYYPLYARVQQEWSAGRLPLWEPGENGGTPMLGSPMAAVLYPGKVLFALFPYDWGVRFYTIGHELLAFWAMVALMRAWSVSWTGTILASLSYAFGGVVLSDYFNIIYLVGAAWLPLGIRAADGWLRTGRRTSLVELAVVLAMQILGGDPEAAYLTLVCASGYAVSLARLGEGRPVRVRYWLLGLALVAIAWSWVGPALVAQLDRLAGRTWPMVVAVAWLLGLMTYLLSQQAHRRARLSGMFLGLIVAAVLALALGAVQILPVLAHISESSRWKSGRPDDLYDSSLLPYRIVEWIWPNVFGTFTAGNHYWMPILPPEGASRPSPLSLYAGALPIVLALGTMGGRKGPPWRAWMTAVALLSLWASLGEFAGAARWSSVESGPTAGDGTFYGLLAGSLPAFRHFRFPFKVLVFTALGLSALAGYGWDQVSSHVGRRRAMLLTLGLLGLTVLTLAMVLAFRVQITKAILARELTHAVFGPLEVSSAVGELIQGLVHGAIALALGLIVLGGSARHPGWAGTGAIAILMIDLAVANAPLVITIAHGDFRAEPAVLRAIRAAEKANPSSDPFRIHRLPSWVPIGWTQTASSHRLRELIDWEIDTLQPGFGLMHGLAYVFADESNTANADFRRLFRPAYVTPESELRSALGVESGHRVLLYPRTSFDLWGVRYFIIPAYPGNWTRDNRSYAAFLDQTDLIYPDISAMEDPAQMHVRRQWLLTRDVQVRRNRRAFPRAWIVHKAWLIHDGRLVPSADSSEPVLRDSLIERLRSADPVANDMGTTAYIESDNNLMDLRQDLTAGGGGPADPSESVSIRYEGPTRVIIDARLNRPGLVVLADAYDSGWRLTIDGIPSTVLRANFLMRAAAVSFGFHRLIYTYEPPLVSIGACVSLAGLAGIACLMLWGSRHNRTHESIA